jgi:hypothetical protein
MSEAPEKEQNLELKVEVGDEYREFVPQEFYVDPVGYFNREGKNIKSGEIKKDETGKIHEDPTATKYLPDWSNVEGGKIEVVGKRVNTTKGQVGKSGNPFYEYDMLRQLNESGLPAAKPICKAEQDGIYLIIMEKIDGFIGADETLRHLEQLGFSNEDIEGMQKQAEKLMEQLKPKFEEAGFHRRWSLKDMIIDIDLENKSVRQITPTDWERTKKTK